MDGKRVSCFYDKFVDEGKFSAIDDISIRRKYWVYSFSVIVFCVISGTLPTFVGYNFENAFAICMFIWELLMFFLLVYFSIRFVILDGKYNVFNKKCYAFSFSCIYILLSLIFAILPIFTTEFISYPDTSFLVKLNPFYYFVIFLPLFFIYVLFCYYAFMKCFGKYSKSGNHNDGNV